MDIKDSPEFQRYTSTCQTQKEADEGIEELGKEMREVETKEEEVEEEKRQHGRVRIDQSQIQICISYSIRWQLRITLTM